MNDPYTHEAMKAAGWESMRVTLPIGLSGAMYQTDENDDSTIEIWWRNEDQE